MAFNNKSYVEASVSVSVFRLFAATLEVAAHPIGQDIQKRGPQWGQLHKDAGDLLSLSPASPADSEGTIFLS